MVVMNYTGDALHFGLAAEQFRSKGLGEARVLMVGDDVAVGREQGSIVGRRYVHSSSNSLLSADETEDSLEPFWCTSLRLRLPIKVPTWTKSKLSPSTLPPD
jgi:hypothetical protein